MNLKGLLQIISCTYLILLCTVNQVKSNPIKVLQEDYLLLVIENQDFLAIQWQEFINDSWVDIDGATNDSLFFYVSDSYLDFWKFRAKVQVASCGENWINSDVVEVDFIDDEFDIAQGDAVRGGKAFFTSSINQTKLIAREVDDTTAVRWGCILQSIPTNLQFGTTNTENIVNNCLERPIAASICSDLNANGYNDWYLPAREELNRLRLAKDLVGGFNESWYWTSTASGSGNQNNRAWAFNFNIGLDYAEHRNNTHAVRCVRPFLTTDTTKIFIPFSLQALETVIEYQPADTAVCKNSSFELELSFTGAEPASFQWFKNNEILEAENSATLYIEQVSSLNEGLYFLEIELTCGSVQSESFELSVVSIQSEIIGAPEMVCPDQLFTLEALGSTQNGQNFNEFDFSWQPANLFENPEEQFQNISIFEPTEIKLFATNNLGCIDSTSAFIDTYPLLEAEQQLVGIQDCEGSQHVFTFGVNQLDEVQFSWFMNNEIIDTATTNSLIIDNLLADFHENSFFCRASNICGQIHSDTITVEVFTAPQIQNILADTAVCRGGDIEFAFEFSGSQSLGFNWLKNGEPFEPLNSNIFSLFSVEPSDEANYQLQIENLCGAANSNEFSFGVVELNLALSSPQVVCPESSFELSAQGISNHQNFSGELTFLWQPENLIETSLGSTVNVNINNDPTWYYGQIIDELACEAIDSVLVGLSETFQNQIICWVTNDTVQNSIQINLENNPNMGLESFNLYTSLQNSNEISFVSNFPYNSEDDFISFQVSGENYNNNSFFVSIIDTCGQESDLSPAVKNIFVQLETENSVNEITWTPYFDEINSDIVNQYQIFRKSAQESEFFLIETVSAQTFTFIDEEINEPFVYVVGALLNETCNESNLVSFSNKLQSSILTSIGNNYHDAKESSESFVKIFPNPMRDDSVLKVDFPEQDTYGVEILTIQGKQVIRLENVANRSLKINKSQIGPGIYLVNVFNSKRFATLKLVVN